jgi:hypothetical protein
MPTQNENFNLQVPRSLDDRLGKIQAGKTVPFASIAEANAAITVASNKRYKGLTVMIDVAGVPTDYHYTGNLTDNELVLKNNSGGALELWTDATDAPNTGTLQGAGTEGDPLAVNTTVIATRAYADSVAGAGVTDGDKGDISVTSGVWTVDNGTITTAKLGGDITAAGKALLDDASVSAQRTTLGLGTIATLAAPSGTVVGTTDTQTLTNKRINPRVQTVASSATVTPNADTDDLVTITAQAVGLTIANPSGTPVAGQAIVIRIKDNSTPQTIAFGTEYRAIGITLPTTTVASKTMYMGAIRNATDTKWDVLSVVTEA